MTVEKDETKGEIKIASKSKADMRRSKTGIISTQKPSGKSVKAIEEITTSGSMSAMADARNMMDSVKDIHANMGQRVASASLYGSFVKSATTSEAPTPGASDEEKEVDDELKDYSIKMTDAELFAACEGRTARKGGRGLVDQTGKFKRVMQDFLRPVDEDEVVGDTKNKQTKRKHTNDDDNEEKLTKKAKKEAKTAKKEAKAAKKEAKAAKKAAKIAKKEAKAVKKAGKEAKKAEKEAKKQAKKEKKSKKE